MRRSRHLPQQERVREQCRRSLHFELWRSQQRRTIHLAMRGSWCAWATARCAARFSFPMTRKPRHGGKVRMPGWLRWQPPRAWPRRSSTTIPRFSTSLKHMPGTSCTGFLGRNPFDASMLMGSGHGNAPYMFFRSYKYTSAPGAIVNGITAGFDNEDGIAFNEGFASTGRTKTGAGRRSGCPTRHGICTPLVCRIIRRLSAIVSRCQKTGCVQKYTLCIGWPGSP